jgi:hypothetical protein
VHNRDAERTRVFEARKRRWRRAFRMKEQPMNEIRECRDLGVGVGGVHGEEAEGGEGNEVGV